jgi:hypothetical protein
METAAMAQYLVKYDLVRGNNPEATEIPRKIQMECTQRSVAKKIRAMTK